MKQHVILACAALLSLNACAGLGGLDARPKDSVSAVSGFTPLANASGVTECGYPLATWQSMSPYNDPGSTLQPAPTADTILAAARSLLGMPPAAE